METLHTVSELLNDFRSIKLSQNQRKWINRLRVYFESNGAIPNDEKFKLIKLSRRYSRQFQALYEAREKARHTNSLKKYNVSRQQAENNKKRREAQEEAMATDVGL